ncbi:MAG: zinc-ribbon domain-containing protein [Candidatus Eisenbacteria bacterium]
MREYDRCQTREVRPQPAMTVHCPHCSTGYLLPDHLVGPRGARVRCPNCQGAFVVLPESRGDRAGDALRESRSGNVFENTGRGAAEAAGAAGAVVMEAEPAAADASRSSAVSVPDPPPAPAPAEEPAAVAAAVLDALVARLGDALVDARLRGKVLSEHGPAIMDAYQEYRRRAGLGASPDLFRAALKGRCGVDLIPRREG